MKHSKFIKPALHQLFIPLMGIFPILAGVSSVDTGLLLGTVFVFVFSSCSFIIFIFRKMISRHLQLPCIIIISATVVTIAGYLTRLFHYGLSQEAGIYLPIMAMNGFLLAGLQEYVIPDSVKIISVNVIAIATGVFFACLLVGLLRQYSGLTILNDSAGLFLLVALLIGCYNRFVLSITTRKGDLTE